ncbi:hypothetical protein ACFOZ5_01150 [Marinobacter lacisalsi]|uniref:Uncharacterized protein n=1 Tax=Marinobacter lacisalsi TaxID=475979 RepID=A0ABV8QBC6_9GAMM
MELKFELTSPDRDAVQETLEALQDAPKDDVDDFMRYILNGNRNGIQSFIKGAVDNPKTWWIGLFTLQMQTGRMGNRLQRLANSNAGHLSTILAPLWADAKGSLVSDDESIVTNVVRYALKYHRSMLVGRLAGGGFTSFASTGGLFGQRARAGFKTPAKIAFGTGVLVTNLALASYGAGIMAVGLGRSKLRDVLFSILTGSDMQIPPHFELLLSTAAITSEELEQLEWLKKILVEINKLAQVGTGPIPISEFCSKPENLHWESICG